jgi:hypothetical protein
MLQQPNAVPSAVWAVEAPGCGWVAESISPMLQCYASNAAVCYNVTIQQANTDLRGFSKSDQVCSSRTQRMVHMEQSPHALQHVYTYCRQADVVCVVEGKEWGSQTAAAAW